MSVSCYSHLCVCSLQYIHMWCLRSQGNNLWQLGITYQKIDSVVDEQVDEPQEEWGILVIDVELGVFSEMQKSVKSIFKYTLLHKQCFLTISVINS